MKETETETKAKAKAVFAAMAARVVMFAANDALAAEIEAAVERGVEDLDRDPKVAAACAVADDAFWAFAVAATAADNARRAALD